MAASGCLGSGLRINTTGLSTCRPNAAAAAANTSRVRVCSTERRRQELCTSWEMLATLDSSRDDKLPIVELRPFTTKEWRPSKSRYVVRNRTTNSSDQTRKTGEGADSLTGSFHEPQLSKSSFFSPRVTEGATVKVSAMSLSTEKMSTHPRLKGSKLTNQSREAAFNSTLERQKSTLCSIRSGQSPNSHFSCLKRALTEVDIAQQQEIRLFGRKMDTPGQRYGLYSDYWDSRGSPEDNRESSPDSSVSVRMEQYLDQCIYDTFDRSQTLPCISVRKPRLKRQVATRGNSTSRKSSGRKSARDTPAYKLGVANSLDFLSQQGNPIGVEQHLTVELKKTLAHLRKTKDIGGVRNLGSKFEIGYPTMGEQTIYDAMIANTTGRQKFPTRLSKSTPGLGRRGNTFSRSDVGSHGPMGGTRSQAPKHHHTHASRTSQREDVPKSDTSSPHTPSLKADPEPPGSSRNNQTPDAKPEDYLSETKSNNEDGDRTMSSNGKTISPAGKPISPDGKPMSPDGKPMSPDGKPMSPDGKPMSPDGKPMSPDGKPMSPDSNTISSVSVDSEAGDAVLENGGRTSLASRNEPEVKETEKEDSEDNATRAGSSHQLHVDVILPNCSDDVILPNCSDDEDKNETDSVSIVEQAPDPED